MNQTKHSKFGNGSRMIRLRVFPHHCFITSLLVLILIICSIDDVSSFFIPKPLGEPRRTSKIQLNVQKSRHKKSAFGKAAIGRNNEITNYNIDEQANGELSNYDSGADDENSGENKEMDVLLQKRDRALIALQTHLPSISLEDCLTILNSYPSLYTEIPSLNAKILYLLNEINLTAKQIQRMLVAHPGLMERVLLDSEDNIASTMEVLQKELDMSSDHILKIYKSLPAILTYNRSELRRRILVYKMDLGYSTDEIHFMVTKDPRMLRTNSQNVRQILRVFNEELGIHTEDVHNMLRKEILLLTYQAEKNIRPTIHYLKQSPIGNSIILVPCTPKERKIIDSDVLKEDETKQLILKLRLKKLVMGHPKILSSSVLKNLQPTVDFFLYYVRMTNSEFGRVLYRRGGSILEANLDRTLRRKVDFLRNALDLKVQNNGSQNKQNDKDDLVPIPLPEGYDNTDFDMSDYKKQRLLAQMLAINPDILTLSIEANLEPKLRYLEEYLHLSKPQLRHLILKRPQLLSLSLERNLKPKIEFLSHSGGKSKIEICREELRDWLVSSPSSLTTVLEKRMKPRVQELQRVGLYVTHSDVPHNFLTLTDSSWGKWLLQQQSNEK